MMQMSTNRKSPLRQLEGRVISNVEILNPLREEAYNYIEIQDDEMRHTVRVAKSRMLVQPSVGEVVIIEIDHPIRTLDENGQDVNVIWEAKNMSKATSQTPIDTIPVIRSHRRALTAASALDDALHHEPERLPMNEHDDYTPPTMDPAIVGAGAILIFLATILGFVLRSGKKNWHLRGTRNLLKSDQNKKTMKDDPDLLRRADALLRG